MVKQHIITPESIVRRNRLTKVFIAKRSYLYGDLLAMNTEDNITQRVFSVPQTEISNWKIWKTIKLGGIKTADDFHKKLDLCCGYIAALIDRVNYSVTEAETEVDLVLVTVAELGFENGASRPDIYERAQKLGLILCSAEVGPQLRIQYRDQPVNQWIYIGMNPVEIGAWKPVIPRVGVTCFCEPWLDAWDGYPDNFSESYRYWVFAKPREK